MRELRDQIRRSALGERVDVCVNDPQHQRFEGAHGGRVEQAVEDLPPRAVLLPFELQRGQHRQTCGPRDENSLAGAGEVLASGDDLFDLLVPGNEVETAVPVDVRDRACAGQLLVEAPDLGGTSVDVVMVEVRDEVRRGGTRRLVHASGVVETVHGRLLPFVRLRTFPEAPIKPTRFSDEPDGSCRLSTVGLLEPVSGMTATKSCR